MAILAVSSNAFLLQIEKLQALFFCVAEDMCGIRCISPYFELIVVAAGKYSY